MSAVAGVSQPFDLANFKASYMPWFKDTTYTGTYTGTYLGSSQIPTTAELRCVFEYRPARAI